MTKHVSVHDEALKNQLMIEDVKVRVIPKMVDNSLVIGGSHIDHKPENKMKVGMVKPKAPRQEKQQTPQSHTVPLRLRRSARTQKKPSTSTSTSTKWKITNPSFPLSFAKFLSCFFRKSYYSPRNVLRL